MPRFRVSPAPGGGVAVLFTATVYVNRGLADLLSCSRRGCFTLQNQWDYSCQLQFGNLVEIWGLCLWRAEFREGEELS